MDQTAEKLDKPSLSWTHPGGKVPDSVLVVALGPSKFDLIEYQTAHEPDQGLQQVDEVWGINAGGNWLSGRVAYDVLWVLDYLDGECARAPAYGRQLEAWAKRHQRPVITSDAGGRDWALEYPLEWVVQKLAAYNPAVPYFHNSIPLVLAYAWAIGVRRLYLWGADYSHESSKRREADRPNAEYWVGWCRALGMEVWMPDTTTLCNSSQGFWVYGYPPGQDRAPRWKGGRIVRVVGS